MNIECVRMLPTMLQSSRGRGENKDDVSCFDIDQAPVCARHLANFTSCKFTWWSSQQMYGMVFFIPVLSSEHWSAKWLSHMFKVICFLISNQDLNPVVLLQSMHPPPLSHAGLRINHGWSGLVVKTDINTNKIQCGSAMGGGRWTNGCGGEKEGNLLCLGELEGFAGEVTFELGHLVFCGAAASSPLFEISTFTRE